MDELLKYMAVLNVISSISTIVAMIVGGIVASKKGRNVGGWVALSFLFSWIAVIIVACLEPLYVPKSGPAPTYKCVRCGKDIMAVNCPYCGYVHTDNEIPFYFKKFYYANMNSFNANAFQNAQRNSGKWYCECGALNSESNQECSACFRKKPTNP